MRVVFMGSPQFAADILEELAERYDVVAVYTQPDKVRGRGKKLVPTPVKALAESKVIEVLTPKTLREPEEVARLRALSPDIVVVAAYGMILPKDVLDVPPLGCVNVHASLLPRWRGAAPIEHAILSGDEYAGVCIMRMEEGLDTGEFCVSRRIPIAGMGKQQVESELAMLGASALLAALGQIESGAAKWTKQPEEGVTYASKIEKGELDMSPEITVEENMRNILASSPEHPSKANIAGRDCIVLKAQPGDRPAAFGSVVVDGKRLYLGCIDGSIEVLELKPAGKNAMPASAFLAGANIGPDAGWSAL